MRAWRHGMVAGLNGWQGDAAWRAKGVHEEGMGDDAPCIDGQRGGACDGLDAWRADLGIAHVRRTAKALEALSPSVSSRRRWSLPPSQGSKCTGSGGAVLAHPALITPPLSTLSGRGCATSAMSRTRTSLRML